MTHWTDRPLAHHEETNVVFFRGISLDSLTRGLLDARRAPLAYGKGEEWGVIMHDMLGWDEGDYEPTAYGPLCADGGELVVFVTEPCIAKAHGPWFEYYRDGRLITFLSFESPSDGGGAEPELLLPALTAARLAGPRADLESDDVEERIARAVAGFFSLPELELV
ncbi:hypothetical protein [Streptomyces sp. NPDC007088]|uniref:hypothetical protein n=1 Tax=Streptomyces sp. NPDC007088 TaxID=3364773 RepID=UPI0036A46E7E